MNKIFIKTLGCDKNFADSEKIAAFLKDKNYKLTKNIDDADFIFINTCSFIDEAKEESIETILNFVEYRNNKSKEYKIIVAGCMVEIYKEELKREIPEIDYYVKPGQYKYIDKILLGNIADEDTESGFLGENFPDMNLEDNVYKFVKVSDGCSLNCSYCIIPKIRGKNKSKTLEGLRKELDFIKKNKHIKEIILVSQNLSYYGMDKNCNVLDLLDLIGEYNFFWKRLLYLDIRKINEKFLLSIKKNNILPYFDIPLQHIDNKVLEDMNRYYTYKDIMEKVKMIKNIFKNSILRTTFITGFPTENKKAYKKLKEFIEKNIFDKVGIFLYSHQDKSLIAKKYDDIISEEEKIIRFNQLSYIAEEKMMINLQKYVDNEFDILIDQENAGRLWMDAPDIDNKVIITKGEYEYGKVYRVKINNAYKYELEGEILYEKHT